MEAFKGKLASYAAMRGSNGKTGLFEATVKE